WADNEGDSARYNDDWNFFKALSFEAYVSAFRAVLNKGRGEWRNDLHRYIRLEHNIYPSGFFCSDVRSLIRLACEVIDPKSEVVQDITDLVRAGRYAEDEPVCEIATHELV